MQRFFQALRGFMLICPVFKPSSAEDRLDQLGRVRRWHYRRGRCKTDLALALRLAEIAAGVRRDRVNAASV
jgi:hypothetical protein